MSDTTPSNTELLWNLIKGTKFAMFTTQHANGHLHSRPMTTLNTEADEDDSLWFFMSRKGDPVADLMQQPIVNVAYADPGEDHYVSVSGNAAVVEDTARKERLWNAFAQAWFPGGVTDPDLALVQVRIAHAHYWDVKASKVTQLFAMAKSVVTGRPPEELGKQGEVRMTGDRDVQAPR